MRVADQDKLVQLLVDVPTIKWSYVADRLRHRWPANVPDVARVEAAVRALAATHCTAAPIAPGDAAPDVSHVVAPQQGGDGCDAAPAALPALAQLRRGARGRPAEPPARASICRSGAPACEPAVWHFQATATDALTLLVLLQRCNKG
jgi:hypothetical protein